MTGLWSLAAMGHALVKSVFGFGVARFFLGLGESGNFPAAIKATAEWFPPKERALATGIFNSGASVGAILAPLIVPWVALHFGWRAAFLVTGIFSATWIVWWSIRYRTPQELLNSSRRVKSAAHRATPAIPWWRLLRYRQAWGFMLGKFLTDPVWWFFLFWLPQYFNTEFKLDLSHIGLPLVVVYVCSTVGSVCGGWLPKGYVRAGNDIESGAPGRDADVRLPGGTDCSCWRTALGMDCRGAAVHGRRAHQGWSANIFTTASDMFPAEYVGTVVSFGQVAGALGGAIFRAGGGTRSAVDRELCAAVYVFGFGLSDRAGVAEDAGAGSEASAELAAVERPNLIEISRFLGNTRDDSHDGNVNSSGIISWRILSVGYTGIEKRSLD